MVENSKLITSIETQPLRAALTGPIASLEHMAGEIYRGLNRQDEDIIKAGLNIRELPEYLIAVDALRNLREAAARQYHKQNNIPLLE